MTGKHSKKEWKMKTVLKWLTIFAFFLITLIGGCQSIPPSASGPDELDLAIRDASDYLNDNIPEGSMIVILNVQSDSAALSDYIIDELIANAVNDRIFKVVDRVQLDLIRAEQNFQLSGEVDDELALSIGQFFGAQTIVSGTVRQLDDRYRMTIRALEVQTAQVQGQYNRNIAAGKTIASLMRGGGTQTTSARTSARSGTSTTNAASTSNRTSGRTPTVSSVTISPDKVSVDKGRTQQFVATIKGNNNPEPTVTWAVTGNTSRETVIDEYGLLTVAADEVATPLIITVTSTINTSRKDSATVTIPGGIAGVNVNSSSTWNTVINKIRSGGNNQTYIINITGNVSVPAIDDYIFGSVMGITVLIQGSGTLTPSGVGNLLRIGTGQTVIVRNVTLRGRSDNNSALVRVMGGGIFRLEGSASVTGNKSNSVGGVHVDGGTFILQDSASVSGNAVN